LKNDLPAFGIKHDVRGKGAADTHPLSSALVSGRRLAPSPCDALCPTLLGVCVGHARSSFTLQSFGNAWVYIRCEANTATRNG
jgi:hypothetical protein